MTVTRRRAVVAGSLAQRHGYGGHAWVFLQYLLGLRRLGYEVLFVDRLEPDMSVDEVGRVSPVDASANLRYLEDVMRFAGLENCWTLLTPTGSFGRSRDDAIRWAAGADVLLNVMGFLEDDDLLGAVGQRVFLDIDPGFGQMWHALDLHDPFRGHDRYVTVGANVGGEGCDVPTCDLEWIATRPPVVLDAWPAQPHGGDRFTSVASWRGPFGPVEYDGSVYGLRVHEFRRFATLPHRTGYRFEIALDIDEADGADLALLGRTGWLLVDPPSVAASPAAYRTYVQQAMAEYTVAKGMYVQTGSGWFSDRSACYLASAKPVLAQDTGWTRRYPAGPGLVPFSTLDEAAAGAREIVGDYARHAREARRIAQECFDSDTVLAGLLERLGL